MKIKLFVLLILIFFLAQIRFIAAQDEFLEEEIATTMQSPILEEKGEDKISFDIKGMDVVDAISSTKTVTRGRFRDVPAEPIEIRSAKVLN